MYEMLVLFIAGLQIVPWYPSRHWHCHSKNPGEVTQLALFIHGLFTHASTYTWHWCPIQLLGQLHVKLFSWSVQVPWRGHNQEWKCIVKYLPVSNLFNNNDYVMYALPWNILHCWTRLIVWCNIMLVWYFYPLWIKAPIIITVVA